MSEFSSPAYCLLLSPDPCPHVALSPCRPYFEELPPDLRFGSMGILLVAAAIGTLIPVVGRRYFHVPKTAFGVIKYVA